MNLLLTLLPLAAIIPAMAAEPTASPAPPSTPAAAPPPIIKPIAIDVGRQLFVDDLLIADTTLTRHYHEATVHGDGPLLKPETPLEKNEIKGADALPVAAPFGDGVWYDPTDNLFKMWYHAGWFDGVAYATSKDGIHWERPSLEVTPGTNRVLPVRNENDRLMLRDAASIWRDPDAVNEAERWKMFVFSRLAGAPEGESHGELFNSADGIHWAEGRRVQFWHGDNTSIFHDPFRQQWVMSVRERAPSLREPPKTVRARFIHTSKDFMKLAERKDRTRAPLWLKLDTRDKADPALGFEPELYHFTATPYESLMIGVFGMFYGPPNDVCATEKRPKIIDLQLGYSRDGFIYDRPHREAFLKCARTPGTWNRGYLHPATGVCLIVGDKLHFYFGTWSGDAGNNRAHMYAGGSTGLATLRRDGFASMDAGVEGGSLTTVPIVFKGSFPFVNLATTTGEIRAEILDAVTGNVIAPFSLENSIPLKADSTKQRLTWKGAEDLASLANKSVRLRFHLKNGALYAFWITPDPNGASHGYVAAGGPGFFGATDSEQKAPPTSNPR